MERERSIGKDSEDKLHVLLGLYESPGVKGYRSLSADPTPRQLPHVGWAYCIYPTPPLPHRQGVAISIRSFGTVPNIPFEVFNMLLPEHFYNQRLRAMLNRITPFTHQAERDMRLQKVLKASTEIYNLSKDLPLGFYVLGSQTQPDTTVEDFIVAPEVDFEDIALLISERLRFEQALNN